MSHSLRFLAVAVFAWAGVRAASLGLMPGTRAEAADPVGLPPIAPTRLEPEGLFDAPPPPLADPGGEAGAAAQVVAAPAAYSVPAPIMVPLAYGYPQPPSSRSSSRAAGGERERTYAYDGPGYPALPLLDETPYTRLAAAGRSVAGEAAQSRVVGSRGQRVSVPAFVSRRIDRLGLSAWAMMRDTRAAPGLANAGTLGGSQAGARLDYRFTRRLAATVRFSSAVQGPRGAEVAPGLRWRPLDRVPLSLIAERRQAIGRHGGRSSFALIAESGFADLAGPLGFRLDSYVQAGVVGVRDPLPFADGAFTATRPLWGRVRGGFGLWGGVQPGLWRIDAGPRVTLPVGRGMKLHVDWRQQLAGNAGPGSGAVATVAADF